MAELDCGFRRNDGKIFISGGGDPRHEHLLMICSIRGISSSFFGACCQSRSSSWLSVFWINVHGAPDTNPVDENRPENTAHCLLPTILAINEVDRNECMTYVRQVPECDGMEILTVVSMLMGS
jgi:hypothetical protein